MSVPSRRKLFKAARAIVTSDRADAGSLLVEDEKIVSILPEDADLDVGRYTDPTGLEVIDCSGCIIAPALVDMHCFWSQPGLEHVASLQSLAASALAGGVARLALMPNAGSDGKYLDHILASLTMASRSSEFPIDIHRYARLSTDLEGVSLDEFGTELERGALGVSDGRYGTQANDLMKRAMDYASGFDALMVNHVEDLSLADGGVMNEGMIATNLGLPEIPEVAETVMLARDLALAEHCNVRYHAAMISTRRSIDLIRAAKETKQAVTAGVSINSLLLTERDIGDYRTFLKLSPPLRDEDTRRALIDAVADGTIDVIVSSNDPQSVEKKRLPFTEAAFGAIGIETMLFAALELANNSSLELPQLFRALATRPAEILGLDSCEIKAGAKADVLTITEGPKWQLQLGELISTTKNSPFENHYFTSRLRDIYRSGNPVDISQYS